MKKSFLSLALGISLFSVGFADLNKPVIIPDTNPFSIEDDGVSPPIWTYESAKIYPFLTVDLDLEETLYNARIWYSLTGATKKTNTVYSGDICNTGGGVFLSAGNDPTYLRLPLNYTGNEITLSARFKPTVNGVNSNLFYRYASPVVPTFSLSRAAAALTWKGSYNTGTSFSKGGGSIGNSNRYFVSFVISPAGMSGYVFTTANSAPTIQAFSGSLWYGTGNAPYSGDIFVGGLPGTVASTFTGSIKNIQVWGRTVAREELWDYVNSGIAIGTTGLLGQWKLDETQAEIDLGIIKDNSGNGNDGSYYGNISPNLVCRNTPTAANAIKLSSLGITELTVTGTKQSLAVSTPLSDMTRTAKVFLKILPSYKPTVSPYSSNWHIGETIDAVISYLAPTSGDLKISYTLSGAHQGSGGYVCSGNNGGGSQFPGLDGSVVTIPYSFTGQEFSVGVWMKATQNGDGAGRDIVNKYFWGGSNTAGVPYASFSVELINKKLRRGGSMVGPTSTRGSQDGSTAIQLDTWYYLVQTWGLSGGNAIGGMMTGYINGIKDATKSRTAVMLYNSGDLRIGGFTINSSERDPSLNFVGDPFAGSIKNVEVWDRVISQQEIQDYLQTGIPISDTGLIGQWSLDGPTSAAEENIAEDNLVGTGYYLGSTAGSSSTCEKNIQITHPGITEVFVKVEDENGFITTGYTQVKLIRPLYVISPLSGSVVGETFLIEGTGDVGQLVNLTNQGNTVLYSGVIQSNGIWSGNINSSGGYQIFNLIQYPDGIVNGQNYQQTFGLYVDTLAPTITTTLSATGWTSGGITWTTGNVLVNVSAFDEVISGMSGAVKEIKWLSGNAIISDFEASGNVIASGSGPSLIGSFSVHENGTYTIYASDIFGNATREVITITNIDREGPSFSFSLTLPNGDIHEPIITLNGNDSKSGLSGYLIQFDSDSAFWVGDITSYSGHLNTGADYHTITITAYDHLGNASTQKIIQYPPVVKIYTTPALRLDETSGAISHSGDIEVEVEIFGPELDITEVLFNGDAGFVGFSDCLVLTPDPRPISMTNKLTCTGTINSGGTLHVLAIGTTGGFVFTGKNFESFFIDNVAPTLTITGGNGVWSGSNYLVPWEWKVPFVAPYGINATDNSDPNPLLTSGGNVDVTLTGDYILTYTAKDFLDNSSSTTVIIQVRDTTPPGAPHVIFPQHNENYSGANISISGTGEADIFVVISGHDTGTGSFSCTTMTNGSGGWNCPVHTFGDGTWMIDAQTFDLSQNTGGIANITFVVDTIVPLISILSPTAGQNFINTGLVSFIGTSDTPGDRITVNVGGQICTAMTNVGGIWNCDLLFPIGNYTASLVAKDAVGNESAPLQISFQVSQQSMGGGGGGSNLTEDNCPNGDFSASYYDGSCGTAKENTGENTDNTPKETNTVPGMLDDPEVLSAYEWAYNLGITTLYPESAARLEDPITREELAKMMSVYDEKILGKTGWNYQDGCSLYSDLGTATPDLKTYITLSCQLGLMGLEADGTTPLETFMPHQLVTRAEFGTVLSRILWGTLYAGNQENRYIDHLKALQTENIMKNISFPEAQELRGRVITMLYRTQDIQ